MRSVSTSSPFPSHPQERGTQSAPRDVGHAYFKRSVGVDGIATCSPPACEGLESEGAAFLEGLPFTLDGVWHT